MSRRAPSGLQRPPSRAPSMSKAAPRTTAEPRRRRLSGAFSAAGVVRMPSTAPQTNINVVVRCRGRSEAEIIEGTPPIVATEGPLSKAITIETSPSAVTSSLPFTTAASYGAGQPNTRTYPFDKVFGPEADQTMIFNEVADNMLSEVLAGYNCTIFAYGQTGTGKTYTMQGDTVPTPLMAPSHDAGIIPRVLHKLFAILEAQENAEYAVKCSYIELYNEELRDLLAPEYKDSVGSNIKIFEDSSKKGVTVQGVEEAGLRDLKDGLAVLAKGTQRRQTAETKLNSESSRSHSIFTLTVHVRETGVENADEDLLRIGKFNLVDLAGSEAIGRSGAENKRAREAGMINQSLLTLGRVISALVDKGSHIPYRESKLTRLLQDSLGGRTKTCIVATVSPTRSNMEETISTLDYALRAKSIKNKPEVNAHLTKAGLLKEYVGDIERLKAELFATREKNGIYIPEDIYNEMQSTQSRQKTDCDSARQRVATIEVELKTRKAEFDTLTSRFVITTEELATARESERQLTALVAQAKSDVETMRAQLDEEKVVSDAFVAGETRLDAVATQLQGVAAESVADVAGLFDKLDRLGDVLDSNTDGATRFGAEMQLLASQLKEDMQELYDVQAHFGNVLRGDMEAYARRGERESGEHLRELESSFGAFDKLAKSMFSSISEGTAAQAAATEEIKAIKGDITASVQRWCAHVGSSSGEMVEDLLTHQKEHLGVVNNVLCSSTSLLDAVIAAASKNIASQSAIFADAQAAAQNAADAEMARLKAQNAMLTKLLGEEQAKSATLRTDLMNNIGALVSSFADARDSSLRSVVAQVAEQNESGVQQVAHFAQSHRDIMERGEGAIADFGDEVESRKTAINAQRGAGEKALEQVTRGMRSRLEAYAEQTVATAEEHAAGVDAFCEQLHGTASTLSRDAAARGSAMEATLASMKRNAADGHQRASKRARVDADAVSTLTSTLLASHRASSESCGASHASAQTQLGNIEGATATFLTNIAIDEPTGATPRKKSYPIPQWQRTQPRHVLIESYRRKLDGKLDSDLSVRTESTAYSRDESLKSSGTSLKSSEVSLKSSVSSESSVERSVEPRVEATLDVPPKLSLGSSGKLRSPKRLGMARKHSGDRERELRALNVLADGGNVPKYRR